MRRLFPLVIRPAALPFLVLALIAPPIAAFALVGPHLGLAVGALAAATVVVAAARLRFDEPIEVAPAPGDRYRLLVVTAEPLEAPATLRALADAAAEGRRLVGDDEQPPELLVVVPATQTRTARWLSDLRAAREGAGRSLAISLGTLAAGGLDAAGRIGDGDPVQAVEDELRSFPAQEVVLVLGGAVDAAAVEEIRRRLDRPVRAVEAAG